MRTFSDYQAAREEQKESGGVLLQLGMPDSESPRYLYGVMSLEEAADMRGHSTFDSPYDEVKYWCGLVEAGYDETMM